MSTVLIVEDEPVDRRHLEASLQTWGHRVISTTDGLEALDIWQVDDEGTQLGVGTATVAFPAPAA